jgi:hypothetical protein
LLLRRKSFQRTLELHADASPVTSLSECLERMNGDGATMAPSRRPGVCVKLVEEYAGVGSLRWRDRTIDTIRYRISRFQGMAMSGLPIPGLHRIEGTLELANVADAAALVGANVALDLEDGRTLALTVADEHGRVLAEGHGPRHGCGCC